MCKKKIVVKVKKPRLHAISNVSFKHVDIYWALTFEGEVFSNFKFKYDRNYLAKVSFESLFQFILNQH